MQRLIAKARYGEMLDALAGVKNALARIWEPIAKGTRKAAGTWRRSFETARAKVPGGRRKVD